MPNLRRNEELGHAETLVSTEAETKLIKGPYFSCQKNECHSKMWNMMINHEISAFPLSLDKAIWFHQGSRLFSILGCRATSAKKVPNVTKHRCRWRRSCRTGRCSGCSDRRFRPRIAPCIHQGTALIPVGDWEMPRMTWTTWVSWVT